MPIITLTTDFGTRDGYVGAVKGVIARIAPQATIVDIAHDIPPGDIAHAAWVVATSTVEFPHEAIHVVIVDPGVGGARAEVIARVSAPHGMHLYVGPDNGVFAYLRVLHAWRIRRAEVAEHVSPTFHGRDVFAYAAAKLAIRRSAIYGEEHGVTGALPWGARPPGRGRVVHVDRFGNLITDLPAHEVTDSVRVVEPGLLAPSQARNVPDELVEQLAPVYRVHRTYEDVAPGDLVAYIGSANTIELAVRDGRADERLRVRRGDEIVRSATQAPASRGPYR